MPCVHPFVIEVYDSYDLEMAGTGGNPELGEAAAQESHRELENVVGGADMVSSRLCIVQFLS